MRLNGVAKICVWILLLQCRVHAQAADADLIKRLLDRVEQLEKRVAELEGGRPSGAVPAAANNLVTGSPREPVADAAMHPGMHHGGTLPPLDGVLTQPALQIAGFSDINFAASSDKRTRSGFSEGQFILHMTSQLSRKVTFFGELSFAARPDAGLGTPAAPGFNMEVERSIIRYAQNDLFKVSFGRYHTPINYWNTAFHHGSWLQTTAARPEVAQFGGSFIPVHFVGALVEGTAGVEGLNLNYSAGTGNGRGSVINRSGDFGDINNNRAWLASAYVRPDSIYGLQVGGAIYRDKISQTGSPEVREWIHSAHLVWDKENPEFIAEFTNVNHRPVRAGESTTSQAFYGQLAWRLNVFDKKFKPYYRYERIRIPRNDLVFRAVPELNGSTFGLRYDLTAFSALKFEYRRQRRTGIPFGNGLMVQTSFAF